MKIKMTEKTKRIVLSAIVALCTMIILSCAVCAFLYFRDCGEVEPVAVEDTLPDGNGVEATVIILAGQSNASGASLDEYLKKNVTAEQYAEYENGYNNVYINYVAGLKRSDGFVKCGVNQGELDGCFGPELGIADKLNEAYPDRTFFIIKCLI